MTLGWMVALALVAADGPGDAKPDLAHAIRPDSPAWPLTLREAIRIGVRNSDVIRVIEDGKALRIERIKAVEPPWNIKSAIAAHVRSIEQQYWALAQQQVQVSSRAMAVKLCEEILAREKAEPEGRGTTADIAEAQQNLERFRLAYITAVSDTITTERQLRNILGLPPTDGRRIVPATAAVEAKVEPDWETCLAAMMDQQPDIAQGRHLVASAEGKEHATRAALEVFAPLEAIVPGVGDGLAERAKAETERQRAALQQVVHQSTHMLARFFLEIDANYKQFQVARRLREATETRLKVSRGYYEEGRTGFTIDRVLDAIVQHSDAVAQEAQYKMTYNTAMAALEEAKGTLLAERQIILIDPPVRGDVARDVAVRRVGQAAKSAARVAPMPAPVPPAPAVAARPTGIGVQMLVTPRVSKDPHTGAIGVDFDVKPAGFDAAIVLPQVLGKPKAGAPAEKAAPPSGAGRVIKYDVSIEGGAMPVRLKGTVEVGPPARD